MLERRAAWKQSEPMGPLASQEDVCMHLTNYAINKHNENFVRDDAVGSKRYLLLCFFSFLYPLAPQFQEPMKPS